MAMDPLVQAGFYYTVIVILLATVVFTRLAVKAKSLGATRFQFFLFILVWAVAELAFSLGSLGIVSDSSYVVLGLTFHLVSMFMFAIFVAVKSFHFLHVATARPVASMSAPLGMGPAPIQPGGSSKP